ncbi:2-aminoadipate transaminase NDAI_0C05960 [Naumovozyma dairenensis CBS 421]|uniref:Aminotransferase class I/classII large domain-containing protein n=1 Tax=Naumovozyma dairenensis (strain ATCC 10597 / BCRC 20456 / CBS 421 / NBRC 0211 / NRRL Y-12639) TaxID=1071378 RepID=G0W8Z4_NAUDC|nr:hypothetical protein NDAI_0C05960 [Naumovozyma dairenensis CBS 421]CCD24255.1 hypothetical protein NDAI_0C05960 [Naumovozyma dairenensis CBS 421]
MDAPATINFFKGHPSSRLLPRKEIIEATAELLSPEERPYDSDTNNRHPLTYGSDSGAYWVRNEITELNKKVYGIDHAKPEYLNLTSGASYGILNILLQTTLPHVGYTKQAFIVTPTYFLINDCFIDAGFAGKMTAIDEMDPTSEQFDGYDLNINLLLDKIHELEGSVHGNSNEDEIEKNEGTCTQQLLNDSKAKLPRSLECIRRPNANSMKKIYKYVLYCVPSFANPSGKSYSLKTKRKLIDLACLYDILIITDDVYEFLNYKVNPATSVIPKRFVDIEREMWRDLPDGCDLEGMYGHVVSNATFSKIIAPGLRVGYNETISSKLVTQLSKGGANVSGGTPSQLNSMIVGTMLRNGSAMRILQNLRDTYKHRSEVLYESIKQWLPKDTIAPLQEGGYFSWVTLPEGYDAKEVGERLECEYGVILANGSNFEVANDERNWGARSVRLSISFMEPTDIKIGIQQWGEVCKKYAKEFSLPF